MKNEGDRCPDCRIRGRWDPLVARVRKIRVKSSGWKLIVPLPDGAVVCPGCGQVLGRSRVPRGSRCGRSPVRRGEPVRFVETGQLPSGDARVSVTGLLHCNSPWTCPWCARTQQVRDAVTLHACNLGFRDNHPGGCVYMLTLTARHHAGVNLRGLRRALTKAYQRSQMGERVKRMRKRFSILSMLRRMEVNTGRSGWHPHIHALLFCDRKLSREELESLREWWFVAFGEAVTRQGFERPTKRDGIKITVADKQGQYLAKMGLLEVAGDQDKIGRCPTCSRYSGATWRDGARHCNDCGTETSRTMWQVLEDIREHNHPTDRRLFMTFVREIRGARRLTYSRWRGGCDLKKLYVAAEQAPLPFATNEIVAFSNDKWRELTPDQRATLYEACEMRQPYGIEAVLGDSMPPVKRKIWDDHDPPPVDNTRLTLEERTELAMAGA